MIEIIENNKNYVVCKKEVGIISQFDETRENMVSDLSEQLGSEIYPIHRLDRDVAGIMVFAKNPHSAASFSKLIQFGELTKCYYAVVEGCVNEKNGRLEDLLYHDKQHNKSFVVDRERKGVKKAVLKYRTVKTRDDLTLVDIELETGRTHQIRVQFSSRGLPLAYDKKYGSALYNGKIALFAYKLSFTDPFSKIEKQYTLPMPTEGIWEQFNLTETV